MTANYRIYIDGFTGSWGDADGIVIVTVNDDELADLGEMSDRQIMDFAVRKAGLTEAE